MAEDHARRRANARQRLIDSGVDPAKIPDDYDVTTTGWKQEEGLKKQMEEIDRRVEKKVGPDDDIFASCSNPGCTNTENLKKCGKCRCISYCSPQCQTMHWKEAHKNQCDPHNILIYYAGKGKLEEVKQYMLEKEKELNDLVYTSALRRACRVGNLSVVQYILRTLPHGFMWTRGGRSPSGHSLIIGSADHDGETLIFGACECGHLNVVKHLISEGADPSTTLLASRATPVMVAAEWGHVEVVRYLVKECRVACNKRS